MRACLPLTNSWDHSRPPPSPIPSKPSCLGPRFTSCPVPLIRSAASPSASARTSCGTPFSPTSRATTSHSPTSFVRRGTTARISPAGSSGRSPVRSLPGPSRRTPMSRSWMPWRSWPSSRAG
ncbi:hypothetical protein ACFFX0_19135 [Citricoccus parietis]|uniref:Uncharacterized protein n=1 Tax=Citricoccus parietis TaxID=592307 RepID=A0ABV5G400_9MICC